AGSDHYGSNNVNQPAVTQPAANVDITTTASIRKPVEHGKTTSEVAQPESGQGIWGR
ncbi:MAG: DUF680 domain-containing protein, partial [Mesorhizobium sp.]